MTKVTLSSREGFAASFIIRDLKIEVFRHFPRTANVKKSVTWPGPCRWVCGLWFTFVRLDHAPSVSDLPGRFFSLCCSRTTHLFKPFEGLERLRRRQGFLHPIKHSQSHVWEEIQLELFCLLTIEFYFKKRNFEDNFSARIEVSGWMKTYIAAVSYHPRILSPKYGQTGNVKPLTANRSLSFAVTWPNLDLKDSISWLHCYLKMSWMKKQHRRAKQADRNSGEATAQIASFVEPVFCLFPPLQNLVLG